MKLYFAGSEGREKLIKEVGIKNALMSFYTIGKKKNFKAPEGVNLFLDSGGFSARTAGATINVYEYINFLLKNKIELYANLDTKSVEETLDNQQKMEEKGLKPLPVYHYSELINEETRYLLDKYCQEHPYVAIGGVVRGIRRKKDRITYLKYCFNIAEQYGTKLHGFGITDPKLLERFKFYSIDSTSWISGSRYGFTYFFEQGKVKAFRPKKNTKGQGKFLDKFNAIQWKKYADYLEEEKI